MKLLAEFRKFAIRGNIADLAVGFTVGAAFTTVARSVVDDLVMPVVGVLAGGSDFSDFFFVLKEGVSAPPYATLQAARQAGAVTLNYGLFVNHTITLLLVAAVMFLVIRAMNRLEDNLEEAFGDDAAKPEEPETKKCPFCRTPIPFRAIRCPHCTSELARADVLPPAPASEPPHGA